MGKRCRCNKCEAIGNQIGGNYRRDGAIFTPINGATEEEVEEFKIWFAATYPPNFIMSPIYWRRNILNPSQWSAERVASTGREKIYTSAPILSMMNPMQP